MHIFISIIKWLVIILIISCYLFIQYHPVFGGEPDEQSQIRIHQSQAFFDKQFDNLEPTIKLNSDNEGSLLQWAWGFINPPAGKNPSEPLPTMQLDKTALINNDMVWFGHSTVLFKTDDQVFITDPVFYRTSPD